MRYFGGKTRIADDIVAVIKTDGWEQIIEPFCGGLSVTAAFAKARFKNIRAADGHPALIAMYKAYVAGWRPPEDVSNKEYRHLMATKDVADPLTAFVGFGCSFSGRYFEGFARDAKGTQQAAQAARSLKKKFDVLLGSPVIFECQDYRRLIPLPGHAIYADPPYEGTKWFSGMPKWSSAEFWQVAEQWAKVSGVYVSEYRAPAGWIEVWNKEHRVSTRNGEGVSEKRIERLFYRDPSS